MNGLLVSGKSCNWLPTNCTTFHQLNKFFAIVLDVASWRKQRRKRKGNSLWSWPHLLMRLVRRNGFIARRGETTALLFFLVVHLSDLRLRVRSHHSQSSFISRRQELPRERNFPWFDWPLNACVRFWRLGPSWVPSQVFSFGTTVANVWKWSWAKIAVKVLFQHRTNIHNCITWRKTVQCLCPVNQIGALKFVTPQWSTPEMSRMTAFLRCPRAAAWPSCSCTSTSMKIAKCETVATSRLGNRLLKTRWFVDCANHTLISLCFFSLFRTMDHRTRLVPIDGPSALDLANARKSGFILVFDVPSPKCFAQTWDRHSCQASKTASAF